MEMTSTTAQREAAAAAPTVLTNSLSDFTPTAATTHPSTFQKSKWKDTLRAVFDGRNLGLHLLTVAVALILLANICFLGIAPNKFSNQALRDNEDYSPDHLLITTGSCDRIQNLDTGSHVVINILGMTLQSAVTSFLIVLGSPRRQHLNNAHAQGKWFDIGTPSVRNFFQLGSGRGMLWIILFLISLPLNTVYNSIVYTQLSAHYWYWVVANEEFITDTYHWSVYSLPPNCESNYWADYTNTDVIQQMQASISTYQKLDNKACLDIYSSLYPATYSDLIMITSDETVNENSVFAWSQSRNSDTGQWLCAKSIDCSTINVTTSLNESTGFYGPPDNVPGNRCDFSRLNKDPTSWTNFGHPIKYCLAKSVNDASSCSLMMNKWLTWVTIAANAGILAVMLFCLTLFWAEIKRSLTSFGDVLASYLDENEISTSGMCLAEKHGIDESWRFKGQTKEVKLTERRWYHTMSRRSIYLFIILLASVFIGGLVGLILALRTVSHDHASISPKGLANLGFGSVTTSNLLQLPLHIPGFGSVTPSSPLHIFAGSETTTIALLSNIPQLLLTIIIFVSTAALTEMTQASSYTRYAFQAKFLRTSTPSGSQRGAYLLGMPFRYAFPFLAMGTLLQWAVSQTLLPLSVEADNPDGRPGDANIERQSLVFSPQAIVVSFAMYGVFCSYIIGLSLMKLRGLMPLASGCSLALSAAVHPVGNAPVRDAALGKVQWGVVGRNDDDGAIAHCSFSISNVQPPRTGEVAV